MGAATRMGARPATRDRAVRQPRPYLQTIGHPEGGARRSWPARIVRTAKRLAERLRVRGDRRGALRERLAKCCRHRVARRERPQLMSIPDEAPPHLLEPRRRL